MIYFTQDSGNLHIKIGHTSRDAEARRSALQTGNSSPLVVLATMPGDEDDETRLHQRFASARVAGEWFRPVPELILLIAEVALPPVRPNSVCSPTAIAVAGDWLIERFSEKLEWPTHQLWQAADRDGIDRRAVHEARDLLHFPERRIVTDHYGTHWLWWVPRDWPHLLPDARPSSGCPNADRFPAGTTVYHATYGKGRVTAVEGFGSMTCLVIRFATGEHKFRASHTRLGLTPDEIPNHNTSF